MAAGDEALRGKFLCLPSGKVANLPVAPVLWSDLLRRCEECSPVSLLHDTHEAKMPVIDLARLAHLQKTSPCTEVRERPLRQLAFWTHVLDVTDASQDLDGPATRELVAHAVRPLTEQSCPWPVFQALLARATHPYVPLDAQVSLWSYLIQQNVTAVPGFPSRHDVLLFFAALQSLPDALRRVTSASGHCRCVELRWADVHRCWVVLALLASVSTRWAEAEQGEVCPHLSWRHTQAPPLVDWLNAVDPACVKMAGQLIQAVKEAVTQVRAQLPSSADRWWVLLKLDETLPQLQRQLGL